MKIQVTILAALSLLATACNRQPLTDQDASAAALAGSAQAQKPGGVAATTKPAAKAEAATDRKLFALILRPGPAWKPGRPFAEQGLRDHFFYWKDLYQQGKIAAFGPLGDDSGLVILSVSSLQDAQAIMRADPANGSKVFVGDVRPYAPNMVNGGAFSIKG